MKETNCLRKKINWHTDANNKYQIDAFWRHLHYFDMCVIYRYFHRYKRDISSIMVAFNHSDTTSINI